MAHVSFRVFSKRAAKHGEDKSRNKKDKSKSKPVAEDFSRSRLAIATVFTAIVSLALIPFETEALLWLVIATLGTAIVWGGYLRRQLGGYTGDTLGASVVFAELVLLLGLAM